MHHRTAALALALALGSLFPGMSRAALLTVGPDGAHATLQAALSIAVANGEDDEIRIQCGSFTTHAGALLAENHWLEISGGWNSSFDSGVQDPACTTLNGPGGVGDQYVIELEASAGDVHVHDLTIANGSGPAGAGLDLDLYGPVAFQLSNVVVRNNFASGSGPAGGGLRAFLSHVDARLEIIGSQLLSNAAQGSVSAEGAAAMVELSYGEFGLYSSLVAGNSTSSVEEGRGGALSINTTDGGSSTVVIENTEFRQNTLDTQGSNLDGTALNATLNGAGFFHLRSSRIHDNADLSAGLKTAQVVVMADEATLRIHDSAIVDGLNSDGLLVTTEGSAQLLGVNLTIAGHPGAGLRLASDSSQTQVLMNDILDSNAGGDLMMTGTATVSVFANLVRDQGGDDPLFVDPINGDYHLGASSPAINSGWPAVPGGLGVYDADYQPRVVDVSVDKGAYEFVSRQIHADGFE